MTALGNPLLLAWPQAHGLPDFDAIAPEHFPPAFEVALAEHRAEIDAIAAQAEAPGFANTLAAFDASGRQLTRLEHLFYTLAASATSPALQSVQRALAAPLAAHGSAVYMHQGLFARIDALFERREALGLTPEQRRLLERVHLDFVRAGARLEPAARERYAAVMTSLAELNTRFAQNVLGAENGYQLRLATEAELAGLPGFVRTAARQAAIDRGLMQEGLHVITLSRSLILPFLGFSARRDLREQAWRAWVGRGDDTGDSDNRAICREILELRAEAARLHGHACYADYALEDTMARSRQAVMELLERVWHPALAAQAREREAVLGAMAAAGATHALEPWDWRFYAEQARRTRFELDESEVKPYFPLDRMVAAMFDCAGRLFGLRFKARPDIAGYHADVRAWEVFDSDDGLRGLFLQDNFARSSKRSGAWMSALRNQSRALGTTPVILNNNNFARGAAGEPTLLSFDDVRTLFHEFGHGLHGLLSSVEHERLAGTQVLRDFVELPSQLFEHWMAESEVLKKFARHWQTDAPLPDALLARLQAARQFGQGYETLRYTASALVDMAVHALPAAPGDVVAFERDTLAAWGLPAEVGLNHRLTHFQHLFSSAGYAAGYYVYLWAEVLDCDAFDAFIEAGNAFDPAVAARLRECIYSSGNSREPGEAFRAFRGRDPVVEPMLKDRGLLA
ncbi:M3 family metallopeptidase [Roseateles saccharophilus]|uniref:Peptidyl-dipeptidase Dcp n=1 Tax=Roseateles saccharophilus TaxID=304 RepID=A0A4R3V8Q1_ROSSA|nr:M3 family metallopeptidase [Roseateles saccharophilus]MDG0832584.1 M3 family peptidase [Roseateles saccharophilus]TCV00321.1 peptidyl-dipeptidase Dcp [Roseateles saccharophilus]